MADARVIQLVTGISRMTNAGLAKWTPTADDGVFNLAFSNYSVQAVGTNEWDDDRQEAYERRVIRILDNSGQLVEEINAANFDHRDFGPTSAWEMIDSIYTGARRIAMGMDKAIASILSELPDFGDSKSVLKADDDELPF